MPKMLISISVKATVFCRIEKPETKKLLKRLKSFVKVLLIWKKASGDVDFLKSLKRIR
jgi:hypothetical protein